MANIYAGSISLIAGTGGILFCDIGATVKEQLHDQANLLGRTLEEIVRQKTKILTGTLQESIDYEYYPGSPDYEDLVFIYARDLEQIQEWLRIYVQYQEGGLLGDPTYTNSPREMFMSTASVEGPDEVEKWGEATIQYALLLCASGAGVII